MLKCSRWSVIEDRSTRGIKKRLISSRNRGVFRLAETVPETWAGRGVEAETLKVSSTYSVLDRLGSANEARLAELTPFTAADQRIALWVERSDRRWTA